MARTFHQSRRKPIYSKPRRSPGARASNRATGRSGTPAEVIATAFFELGSSPSEIPARGRSGEHQHGPMTKTIARIGTATAIRSTWPASRTARRVARWIAAPAVVAVLFEA